MERKAEFFPRQQLKREVLLQVEVPGQLFLVNLYRFFAVEDFQPFDKRYLIPAHEHGRGAYSFRIFPDRGAIKDSRRHPAFAPSPWSGPFALKYQAYAGYTARCV